MTMTNNHKCSLNCLKSLSSVELVFSNDLIFQSICARMEVRDLKTCRRVCRYWRFVASRELLKLTRTTFRLKEFDYYRDSNKTKAKTKILSDRSNIIYNRSLNRLIILLSDTYKSADQIQFPCSDFSFLGKGNFSNPSLKGFLTHYGHFIKKLHLELELLSYSIKSILNHLKKLVVDQAYNVQDLSLLIHFPKEDGNDDGGYESEQKITDYSTAKACSLKLKRIKFKSRFPKNVVYFLINLAPNLQEVNLLNQDLHYLFEAPVNLLHLQREFYFNFFSMTNPLRMYEQIAVQGSSLRLRKIHFYFEGSAVLMFSDNFKHRFTLIITKLIKFNSNYLVKVVWELRQCLGGIKIPRLPKLKELCFGNFPYDLWSRRSTSRRIDVQKFVPGLTTIRLLKDTEFTKTSFDHWVRGYLPVSSVQNVYLGNRGPYCLEFVARFRYLFPNARISYC